MKIIVACDKKNGIGKNNKLPWNIPEELEYFKKITTHTQQIMSKNIVIMGRNTWESIPNKYKPLSDRINIIITSKDNYIENTPNVFTFKSLDLALVNIQTKIPYGNKDNIYIIGGNRLYTEAINNNICEKIYVTEIYNEYDCDTFFPTIPNNYKLFNVSNFKTHNEVYYRNLVYININHYKYVNNCPPLWKNKEELQYIHCLEKILKTGYETIDRTNVGTLSIFGETFKYDLQNTFPLLTTKKMFIRGIFEEFKFYLSGKTDNSILRKKNINIWNGNTSRSFLDKRGLQNYPENDMGETYGFNFRHYGATYDNCKQNYQGQGFDQLTYVINEIKTNPSSRRIIIDLWNCATLHKATLPSCLCKYQFNVNQEEKLLNLMIYIRSSDFFLANNWNTITGAFFVHMICNLEDIDLTPGILTVITGDTHIYKTHIEQVTQNLERIPKPFPKLVVLNKRKNIEDFIYSDMKIIGYSPEPNIAAKMAV